MMLRGVRGATTAAANTRKDILEATTELLTQVVTANDLRPEDVAAAFFTTTVDLNATFPALAARLMGWDQVPLLCAHEMNVPGSLERCIRVLILVNTDKPASEIRHVYIRGAANLRQSVAEGLS